MFTWAGVCSSVTKNTSPLIAMLDPSLYSCSIDFANNIVSLLLSPSALTGQSSYRLSVGLINPTISVSNVSVVVKAVQ